MIKAVFFDIDGTLVSFETHKMPDSTRSSLYELKERGVRLFVASGRHRTAINNLENFPFDGYVTLNGSVCLLGDEVVHKQSIPADDIASLLDYVEKKEAFPCIFIREEGGMMNYRDETVSRIMSMVNLEEPPLCTPDEIRRSEIFQVLGFFRENQEERVMRMMPGSTATRWNPLFTDIIPAGSNKWKGISVILERWGILPEETMAFGDGGNDTDMLQGAGIGVAMGNAAEEVKRTADYVTGSVDEDGIRDAFRHFGLL